MRLKMLLNINFVDFDIVLDMLTCFHTVCTHLGIKIQLFVIKRYLINHLVIDGAL